MTARPFVTLALGLSGAVLMALFLHPALAAGGGEDSGCQEEGRFRSSATVVLEGPGIYASFEADQLADRFFTEFVDHERSGPVLAEALTLRRRIDGSSPSLERALVNADPLRVTIELGNWWGEDWVPLATVQLQEALLIGSRQELRENVLADFASGRGELWEELSLSFRQYEFTWLETGSSASWTSEEPR